MVHNRKRLRRLEQRARVADTALEEAWCREAARRLTDQQLHDLRHALRREEHLEGEEFPQLEVSAEEKEAIFAFNRFYEEAKRGV